MIDMPDVKERFNFENGFFLSCETLRIGRLIAHWNFYWITKHLKGDIVECGVFKGNSFTHWAMFDVLEKTNKRIVGFDTFDEFPKTTRQEEKEQINKFIKSAGNKSISTKQLKNVLKYKGCKNFKLIKGDICKTVKAFAKKKKPISLLHLDTDLYDSSKIVLEQLYPLLVYEGVLILDNYNVFPGETMAVNEYFKDKQIKIHKHPYANIHYIIKR